MDPIDEIWNAFAGTSKLASATGIKITTVCDWRRGATRNIPSWRRPAILAAARERNLKLSDETLRYLAEVDS